MNILDSSIEKYLVSVSTTTDALLTDMEIFASENNIPILDKNSIRFLEILVKSTKPKSVLEIGTAIGYSTIRIVKCLSDDCKITTIEKSGDNIVHAKKYFARASVENKIDLLFGDAKNILPEIRTKFDLIFLDADKKDYVELFNLSLPLLSVGGIYIADNLLWGGYIAKAQVPKKEKPATERIKKFNEIFLATEKLNSTILPIGDGIGFGVKVK